MKKWFITSHAIFAVWFLSLPIIGYSAIWLQEDFFSKKNDLIVKRGEFPAGTDEKNISDTKIYIMDMEYKSQESNLTDSKIAFHPLEKGNYHIFLEHRFVKDGILFIEASKMRKYNQKGDIKESLLKEIRGKSILSHYGMEPFEKIPFEIIIEKPIKAHHINCCLYSGDIARFKVYLNGVLQKEIPLHVTTQYGWQKSVEPAEDGIISFEIPRDKYVDAAVNKRFMESLFIEAEYEVSQKGSYKDVPYSKIHYSMTLPLIFHTSPLEYSSKLPAYLTVIGVILVFAFGFYYSRKRKKRSYKEIWFEEK